MQVNLKVLAGPYKGRIFSFTQHDSFLIGRSRDAHLYLPDDRYFSRNHCLLEINPPRSFLRDLNSTNGTFVNGRRVAHAFLNDGDRIRILAERDPANEVQITHVARGLLSDR